jgi:glycosyltransferase 2 family protein
VDLPELARLLARTDWSWTLLAVALAPAGLWARAARWRYLFPPDFDPPGLPAATLIGYMANNVLPLRAGEIVRIYVVARRLRAARGMPAADSFWLVTATLVVERVLDSLALVLIMAGLIVLIAIPPLFKWVATVLLAIDVIGVALLVSIARAPDAARALLARLTGRWPAAQRVADGALGVALRGLDGVRARSHALPLLGWTALAWLCPATAAWSMLRAVHVDLPFVAGVTVLVFVGLGISVPSAPGYVGVWHAAAVLALAVFGVPQAPALAYALLYHASQFVPITLLGWLALVREHLSLTDAAHARERVAS